MVELVPENALTALLDLRSRGVRMNRPPVPAEAVEAAADLIVQGDRGACECRRSIFDKHDANPPCSTRREAIRVARAALEAAAPHMLAGAWDEGWDTFAGFDSRPGGPYPDNPYRTTT